MTLIAERSPPHAVEAAPAFATPTIVHFGAVLLLSAIQSAPWREITIVTAILGLMGLVGVVYIINVARKMRAQAAYQPEFGNWLHNALLPLAAYAMLALSAFTTLSYTSESCLALEQRRCCCFSSAFITPGIVLSILYFTASEIQIMTDADRCKKNCRSM